MKKLMLAAAVVCAAVMAQAGAINWSASLVADPWATAAAGGTAKPANGWVGYAILASDLTAVTADLNKNSTAVLTDKNVGPVVNATSKGKFDSNTATGRTVAGGNQDFYLIVLNNASAASATHYYVSEMVTQAIDDSLDTTVQFGKQDEKSKVLANWTAMSAGPGPGPDPIPEPTSGLLVALGMGLVALRRRRA